VSNRSTPPEGTETERPIAPAEDRGRDGEAEADQSEETPDVRVVDRRWWARDDSESPEGARSDKPTYVEELETQLVHKDELLTDYAARYKTAAKEFEDTRVRLRKEVAKDIDREKRRVLASFLDIVDNLDRAIAASRDAADDSPGVVSLLTGVEMVRQQFLLTLNSYGVERIEAGGTQFDPNRHDAISVVPVTDSEQDGVVINVVKPGYQLADEILRPATVTVGKLAPEPQ
jgi:molecular chaperone GrpE (heat shock protein)